MSITISELQPIFREVLEDDSIVVEPSSTASDIPGWDSLNHIYLVVGIEQKFKVKFTTTEIQSWKNTGDIVADINRKRNPK